jgi:hypothetical protein
MLDFSNELPMSVNNVATMVPSRELRNVLRQRCRERGDERPRWGHGVLSVGTHADHSPTSIQ